MTHTQNIPEVKPKHRALYDELNSASPGNSNYSNEYRRRTASSVSQVIYDISQELRLPEDVQMTAAEYYKTASQHDLIAGASQETMVGAAVRASSMNHEMPRPLGLIAEVVDETQKSIRTKLSQLMQVIDIDYVPVEADDYVEFIATELEIPHTHPSVGRAHDILEQKHNEDDTWFYSKSPIAVAGGAMYGALRYEPYDDIIQSDVAKACRVSEVSIRNHYQPLLKTYEQ